MNPWRACALAAACALTALAVSGPVDRLADASFAWHMFQHLVLLFAVAPLLLASRPFETFARYAGKRYAAAAVRLLRPLHALAWPPVALATFVAVLWLTHVTPLYELALERPAVHALEHALYLGAGVVFWLPLMNVPPLRPLAYPARLFYAFVALPQCAFLGFVLGAAREPWYPHYVRATSVAQALADQRNAAAVMWIAGGFAVLLALLVTLGRWAWRETKEYAAPAALCAGALLLTLLAPAAARADEPGRSLYETTCASCHGAKGQGSENAPPLIGKSAADVHLMLDTGGMPADVPYVDQIHQRPHLTAAQMDALVSYVETLSPHADRALPLVLPGSAVRGRLLYAENCAACHGPSADGSSVGSDNVAPSLRSLSAVQVAEAIRSGPGVMPRFGPHVLSGDDVDAIASYIGALRSRSGLAGDDRGGISLGHAGPVAEGFIAWLFGLGFLVLCVREIAKL